MNILFWVPYPKEGASNRYRIGQYLPYLDKAGIKYSIRSFWTSGSYAVLYKEGHYVKKTFYFLSGVLSRIMDIFLLHRYDLVFVHREAVPIGTSIFESLLTILRKPFIFDFDDAIFLPSSSRYNNFIEKLKRPDKVKKIIKMSSCVIAGNNYLAEFARVYNDHVKVINTPIDTEKYAPTVNGSARDAVIIGWMGSATTLEFIDMLKGVFKRLEARFADKVTVKIVGGDVPKEDFPSNVVSKPWALDEEPVDLTSFDIGIMPMPDNEWTRGKCGFKAILYMSCGIPCVSSPVGINKDVIEDGVNGFLAYSDDEWFEKLSFLIENPAERNRLGKAARKTIEAKYSLKVNAPKFLNVFKDISVRKAAK